MGAARIVMAIVFSLLLAACGDNAATVSVEADPAPEAMAPVAADSVEDADASLAAVLAAQPGDAQARYRYRNPAETLEFFGIEAGMTVVEALPGGGWYTKILLPYLGDEGELIGVNYPLAIFQRFGSMSDEQIAAQETWVADWTGTAEGWRGEGDAAVSAFVFGALPEALHGTADAALVIRALHNLARFEAEGGFLSMALADLHAVLKPGGIVGVVQHEAPPDIADDWAAGQTGYLKRSFVVDAFQAAGFELVDESDINANPLDQPTTEDSVWRLPPSLATSRDDPELRGQMEEIGESNRMTLKFRKGT